MDAGTIYAVISDQLVAHRRSDHGRLWRREIKLGRIPAAGKVNTHPRFAEPQAHAAPPVLAGGALYLACLDGTVRKLDPATGKELRRWTTGHSLLTQPAVDGGRLYLGTWDAKVICIDTGDPKATGWGTWGRDAQRRGATAAAEQTGQREVEAALVEAGKSEPAPTAPEPAPALEPHTNRDTEGAESTEGAEIPRVPLGGDTGPVFVPADELEPKPEAEQKPETQPAPAIKPVPGPAIVKPVTPAPPPAPERDGVLTW